MCNLSWTPHSNLEKDNPLSHSCVSPRMGCLEYTTKKKNYELLEVLILKLISIGHIKCNSCYMVPFRKEVPFIRTALGSYEEVCILLLLCLWIIGLLVLPMERLMCGEYSVLCVPMLVVLHILLQSKRRPTSLLTVMLYCGIG